MERIDLSNGLTLEIWDYSRRIAGDRWLVGFLAQVGVQPKREDFSSDYYYQRFLEKTEGYLYYRYTKERTFVPEDEVFSIFQRIKENFLKAVLPYLNRASFKERLIISEVTNFEKRIDWENYLEQKEKEELGGHHKNLEFI